MSARRSSFLPCAGPSILALAGLTLAGCGFGTATAVGAAQDDGSNGAPALTDLEVLSPKVPELTLLRFVLMDQEADPTRLRFSYDAAGVRREMAFFTNPDLYPSSQGGRGLDLPWNFATEVDLDDPGFHDEVRIYVEVDGRPEVDPRLVIGLGNNAPVIDVTDDLDSATRSGTIVIPFEVSDTSDDVIVVRVEFNEDAEGGYPEEAWRPARRAGLPSIEPTPENTLENLRALRTGSPFDFSWDSLFDLGARDRTVKLRFTPDDLTLDAEGNPIGKGMPDFVLDLHVNNNEEPLVVLEESSFLVNPDDLRGIPVRYRLLDVEGDPLAVVFQWGRNGRDFPALPTDPAELREALADPVRREALQICRSFPRPDTGFLAPPVGAMAIGATTLRLPELASTGGVILGRRDLLDLPLELLRPAEVPERVAGGWSAGNLLTAPVAALALGDGRRALVLDGTNSWRLLDLDLATGAGAEIASGTGSPTALAAAGPDEVLVASDVAGDWQVERVALGGVARSTRSPLGPASLGGSPQGRVRGLVSLGSAVAIATLDGVQDHVLRLDWRTTPPTVASVLPVDALSDPWGVTLDPGNEGHVLVAERGQDRVVRVDLERGAFEALPITGAIPAPTGLALDGAGRGAFVLCDPGTGPDLRLLGLGGEQGIAAAVVGSVPADAVSVATGPDALIVVPLSGADLAVGGGLEQVRTVVEVGPAQQVTVDEAFDPRPQPGQPWRLRSDPFLDARRGGNPEGKAGLFTWDARPLAGRRVLLRATVLDAETGLAVASSAPKELDSGFVTLSVGGPGITSIPSDVLAVDVDGDGQLDLVSANAGGPDLTVFRRVGETYELSAVLPAPDPQAVAAGDLTGDGLVDLVAACGRGDQLNVFRGAGDGTFGAPIPLGGGVETRCPFDVALADLDGDGDLDVVSANGDGNDLSVFLQPPGGFAVAQPMPDLRVGDATTTRGPFGVAVADLDGDGLLDLVSANGLGDELAVFSCLSTAPLTYATEPLRLGPSLATGFPREVQAVDLDGDGRLDLLAACATSNTLAAFLQPPGGFVATAEPDLVLGDLTTTPLPHGLAVGDLNADGHLDLVCASRFGDGVAVFHTLTSAEPDPVPVLLGDPTRTAGPQKVRFADLDGDGRGDLVVASGDSDQLTVFLQQPRGRPTSAPTFVGGPETMERPTAVAAADMDGDGDLDLVTASLLGQRLVVFEQTSSTAFDPLPRFAGGPGVLDAPSAVQPVDFDGDGVMDLVAANENGQDLVVFRQESSGAVPEFVEIARLTDASVLRPLGVLATDLTGNGEVDFACANFNNTSLTLFLQDAGAFDVETRAGAVAATSVAAADLDRDGFLDLISANAIGDNVAIFPQTFLGFSDTPVILGNTPITNGVSIVRPVDLDLDGRTDLVTGSTLAFNSLAVRLFYQGTDWNLVDGLLVDPLGIASGAGNSDHGSVAVGDLDGDGDTDVVVGLFTGVASELWAFDQVGRTFLDAPSVLGQGATLDDLLLRDLDGDGDLDVVATDRAASHLRIHWGGRRDP